MYKIYKAGKTHDVWYLQAERGFGGPATAKAGYSLTNYNFHTR